MSCWLYDTDILCLETPLSLSIWTGMNTSENHIDYLQRNSQNVWMWICVVLTESVNQLCFIISTRHQAFGPLFWSLHYDSRIHHSLAICQTAWYNTNSCVCALQLYYHCVHCLHCNLIGLCIQIEIGAHNSRFASSFKCCVVCFFLVKTVFSCIKVGITCRWLN